MKWQIDRAEFFREERQAIRRAFSDVAVLEIGGHVFLRGAFPVHDDFGSEIDRYDLDIVFPQNYPDQIPVVFAVDKRIEPIVQRHVFPRAKRACLCLPHEIPLYLPKINFMGFWEKLLKYWLVGQASYDQTGRWPFPERAHDATAIHEGFSELLGISDQISVKRFTHLLIRKSPAKGHEVCPCGSGKRLRSCHQEIYHQVRALLSDDVLTVYRKLLK